MIELNVASEAPYIGEKKEKKEEEGNRDGGAGTVLKVNRIMHSIS